MRVSLGLSFLLALLHPGTCLQCEICHSMGKSCFGTMKTCTGGEDTCGIILHEVLIGGMAISSSIKSCLPSHICQLGPVTVNYGKVKAKSHLVCCTGDDCRTTTVSLPPDNDVPNGYQCPACYSVDSFQCGNEVVNCTGSEDQCVDLAGLMNAGGLSLKAAMKGCTTISECNMVGDGKNSLGMMDIKLKRFQCRPASVMHSVALAGVASPHMTLLPVLSGLILEKCFVYTGTIRDLCEFFKPCTGSGSSQDSPRVYIHYISEHKYSIKESGKTMLQKMKNVLRIRNRTIREMLAEALGTFILMVFGLSSVAQVILGKGNSGQYLSINLAFGIGATLGIYAAGGVSGGHLNAAITITQCILGNISGTALVAYIAGQFLGSFVAAATVFAVYYDAIYHYTNGSLTVSGPTATAMIFSTYPAPNISLQGAFFTEFMATIMLVLGVLVIHDEKNNAAIKGAQPMLTGMLVLGIGLGMGLNTGYAINPSRDLPPRIFTAIAGWGMDVFTSDHSWWWVPVTAPVLGCLAGVLIYKLCIDFHNLPGNETEREKEQASMETSKL